MSRTFRVFLQVSLVKRAGGLRWVARWYARVGAAAVSEAYRSSPRDTREQAEALARAWLARQPLYRSTP